MPFIDYRAGAESSTSQTGTELWADGVALRTRFVTAKAGRVYTKGEVLGEVSAAGADLGKARFAVANATDGSQTPRWIANETIDATVADVQLNVGVQGEVLSTKLIFDNTFTLVTLRNLLHNVNILIRNAGVR